MKKPPCLTKAEIPDWEAWHEINETLIEFYRAASFCDDCCISRALKKSRQGKCFYQVEEIEQETS